MVYFHCSLPICVLRCKCIPCTASRALSRVRALRESESALHAVALHAADSRPTKDPFRFGLVGRRTRRWQDRDDEFLLVNGAGMNASCRPDDARMHAHNAEHTNDGAAHLLLSARWANPSARAASDNLLFRLRRGVRRRFTLLIIYVETNEYICIMYIYIYTMRRYSRRAETGMAR